MQAEDVSGHEASADWQRRVVGRSLRTATKKSIDRGAGLIHAAAALLERSDGEGFTVQDVADEAGQSLRTLYQYFESKDDLLLAVFEEAMRTYARMIRESIAGLDDPMERLAGAIIAAARMPERSNQGVDKGLARLRLNLAEAEPDLVAKSREPLSSLFRELVTDAVDAKAIRDCDPEAAAYMIVALNSAFIVGQTLGNDFDLRLPDVMSLTTFCLQGLNADVDTKWYGQIAKRVHLPPERVKLARSRAKKKPSAAAPARKASRTR